MASASSSVIAQGASRASVGRHATLQPVSSLRVKPFTTVKYIKSRGSNASVGVRNVQQSNASHGVRKPSWPLCAADTDPVLEDDDVVADGDAAADDDDDDDVDIDLADEDYETEEAEATIELSDEQAEDRAFLIRQIGQISDEASGEIGSTAEEETAAAETEEGVQQLIDAVLQMETLTQQAESAYGGEADLEEDEDAEDAEVLENPLPFSDEYFYDEVYKNMAEIDEFDGDIVDFTKRDPTDEALVEAAAETSMKTAGTYPSGLDEYDSLDMDKVEFSSEEQAVMDMADAMPDEDPIDLPNGVKEMLGMLTPVPLDEEETAALASAEPADLDQEEQNDLDAALDLARYVAGIPDKTELSTSGLYVIGELAKAAESTDLSADALAALDAARDAGDVSAAEYEQLAAAAAEMAGQKVVLPSGLYDALDEKLDEVDALGTVVEEKDAPADAALEAEVAALLAANADKLTEFAELDRALESLEAPPEPPTAPGAAIFDQARDLLGEEAFQAILEEAIQDTNDPALVAEAKAWFLAEAQGVVPARELAAMELLLAPRAVRDSVSDSELEVPDVDTSALDELLTDPSADEGVSAAIDAQLADAPVGVVDASLYIRDSEHPVMVEYTRLKKEVLAVTGADLDNYAVANEGVDAPLLEVVARMLQNAAEGKELSEGLDQVELPEVAAIAPPTFTPELEDVRQQLQAIWDTADDIDYNRKEEEVEEVEDAEAISLELGEADEDEDLDPRAGFVQLPDEDDTFAAPSLATEDAGLEALENLGEFDTAVEAKWMEVSEEEWAEAAADAFNVDESEDVTPEVALARAEAALGRFTSKGGDEVTQEDIVLLKEICDNIVEAEAAVDPAMGKLRQARVLATAAMKHTEFLERAFTSAGLFPGITVPRNMNRDEAAQFVQAYGGKMVATLKAAEEKAEAGIRVRSLVDALADPSAKAEELDADAIEADVRALAAQVLSPEEIAELEANTTAEFIDGEDIAEPEEETDEQLAEKYTESEIIDIKARRQAAAAPMPQEIIDAMAQTVTPQEEITSLLAELGYAAPAEAAEEAEETVEASAAEGGATDEAEATGEQDDLALAFHELLEDIVDEVREGVEDAEYVEDAVMYQEDEGVAAEDDGEDAEEGGEVEEGWEYDEAEANALLEEVIEEYDQEARAQGADDVEGDEETSADDGTGDADEADEGEAELQTMYNTTQAQLMFDDYEDVWEAMGIPEARPKVPQMPRAKEESGEDGEGGEDEDDYVEEEEEGGMADEEDEVDVADAIANYYAPDALDDGEVDNEVSGAPKSTMDLFGSAPYLEEDGDRASDDTSGLLERVTVSKTGSIFVERVIQVTRVTKVVKGGKIMSFRCVAVVGNRNGIVGVGVGSAREVVQAVTKACQDAKSSLIAVPLTKFDSTPHRVETMFKGSKVVLNPAADGTGCIAGGAVRSVLELAGVKNCLAKRIGSRNPLNNARATIKALEMLQTWGEVAAKRGLPIQYLFARDEESAAKALAAQDE